MNNKSKIQVDFGDECKPEIRIELTGIIQHAVLKISPSFGLLGLNVDNPIDFTNCFSTTCHKETDGNYQYDDAPCNKILDVMLTRDDGWTKDQLDQVLSEESKNGNDSKVTICGYPERRIDRFVLNKESKYIFILHAKSITFHDTNLTLERKMTTATNTVKVTSTNITNNNDLSSTKNEEEEEEQQQQQSQKRSSVRGANDASRFAKLVFFILKEFGGYERLGQRPILDIAGGAGGLAFELVMRHQLPCVVVDTRPVKFKGNQKRSLEFRKSTLEKLQQLSHTTPLIESLKRRFQVGQEEEDGGTVLLRQFNTLFETDSILNGSSSNNNNKKEEAAAASRDGERNKLCALLTRRECSLLVGLHPDQATDPIIEIGCALKIPWVVVPCCVFPNLLKERRLQNSGKTVRNYDDLCSWILQRDDGVKETTLPFRGRNRVFYWHPPDDD